MAKKRKKSAKASKKSVAKRKKKKTVAAKAKKTLGARKAAKPAKRKAKRKTKAKAPSFGQRVAGAFEAVSDTIKETRDMRNKMTPPASDDTE